MLVVNRFRVGTDPGEFTERAHAALRALGACAGFLSGRLGRAPDDPELWALATEWKSVGAYRRALSNFDVKMYATPLLAQSIEEPSAYEVLASLAPGGELTVAEGDWVPVEEGRR
ncbi:antibiotic biosynthesis monooxygenase family protein [Longispora albida]|uniref:antibiotic biosynthesis monooxygenase family protein n=1 Tax=Longispora albida TaxID=203523 RepID=UPI000377C05E|nr:antibiotic biosynthesis monooxygenase [Longispora albida]